MEFLLGMMMTILLILLVATGFLIWRLYGMTKPKVEPIQNVHEIVRDLYNMDDEAQAKRYRELMRAWDWNGEHNESIEDLE